VLTVESAKRGLSSRVVQIIIPLQFGACACKFSSRLCGLVVGFLLENLISATISSRPIAYPRGGGGNPQLSNSLTIQS
jgi:hypothetical protein